MTLRQKVWIDKSVQGVLMGRVILYWLTGVLYVVIGVACFQYNQNPSWTMVEHGQEFFNQIWPWLPTAILVLPLAIYDVVRLSNLFVGPIYRLRKQFVALRNDIACAPLKFREDDYWCDLTAPVNDLQAEILRLHTILVELQQSNIMLATENTELKSKCTVQNRACSDEDQASWDQATIAMVRQSPTVASAAVATQL